MPRKIIKTPGQVGHSTVESAVNHRQAHGALLALANPNKAEFLAGFFKTGKGQYAEGDRFLGITVPAIRQLSRQFGRLGLTDCERLLQLETKSLGQQTIAFDFVRKLMRDHREHDFIGLVFFETLQDLFLRLTRKPDDFPIGNTT
jgi:hypothetical protein